MNFSKQKQADGLLFCTTFIAAFGWVCSRESVAEMPVLAFIAIRFLLASVALLLLSRPAELRNMMRSLRAVILTGFLQTANILLWIYAVATTKALGEGAFIMSLSMLFVPLFAWLILGNRPVIAFWIALPISMSGLALLTLKQGLTFEVSQLLFLASALLQAVYFCFCTRFAATVPVQALAAFQLGCTGIIALLLSLLFEQWPQQVSESTWGWLLSSAFIATSLRFWLQLKGQSMTTAANAALIMIIEPLLTVLAATLWYGEKMTCQQLTGCVLIIVGLVYYRLRQAKGA
ncbi:DMT family transporter [Erwinia sp. S63]|uniref:DMT family transporter n=1 Tax=Erwiniaceae TaxID=1903409 RepID=UPI00190B6CDA|nr:MULTISPECIES: DMT family transporter [Erwiniaceae]MBK0003888.1 DMT family transporter [Erwinia sp. S38]MBK0094221.1 DMT family transporter [Erwinia sp. S59]MBK0099403.1 DMT family transporter [Erwinia sp. S63]MBK0127577.1 DMT family transporter [Pantoea sp. S61]